MQPTCLETPRGINPSTSWEPAQIFSPNTTEFPHSGGCQRAKAMLLERKDPWEQEREGQNNRFANASACPSDPLAVSRTCSSEIRIRQWLWLSVLWRRSSSHVLTYALWTILKRLSPHTPLETHPWKEESSLLSPLSFWEGSVNRAWPLEGLKTCELMCCYRPWPMIPQHS